jgi:hypothetical protein
MDVDRAGRAQAGKRDPLKQGASQVGCSSDISALSQISFCVH